MNVYDIVIVGAGLSGLICAKTLLEKAPHLRVLVVEARGVIGGRVCPVETFSSQTIEMGAELIHGQHSVLTQLLDNMGMETQEITTWAPGDGPHPEGLVEGGCGYYYLGSDHRLFRYDHGDPDFIHMNQVIHDLSSDDRSEETILEYLATHKVTAQMMDMARAGYSNTLCSELEHLPRVQTAELMDAFERDGPGERINLRGWKPFLNQLARGLDIRTTWVVEKIAWSPGSVTLTSTTGEVLVASKVVITASLSVLQRGIIEFKPPIPPERQRILNSIRMEPCVKLALRFNHRFVPNDFRGMICQGCIIPEFWSMSPTNAEEFVLMGFATSRYAKPLRYLSRPYLRDMVLKQLDRIWGTERNPHPAKDSYLDMIVQDWTAEKYIGGGYSSPSFHVTTTDRDHLGSPLHETIYWAGEGFHPTRYMVMQGALESGIHTAHQLLQTISNLKPNFKPISKL